MNQHEEFKDKPVIDPVTGQPMPQAQMSDVPPARSGRSNWPIIIILLAGLVLALIAWLPAELSRDTANTAAPPPTTDQPATGQSTPDATAPGTATPGTAGQTTPPADNSTAPSSGTATQPAPEATPQQAPETQGSTPNSTPGTTPSMTQPAQ
ncbi:hypothetical protein PWG15_01940 [Ensifer adhaerens]|uniref:hypothetical protein n=1 Tax=Ensifer adhaerens TaxID=106592 RepID=UPI0023A9F180|nr:hypothetical protein [Ensifer adhaerens]WDZ77301.1 hypothetical protein PWG15_01940 [Ensifer adhaerens]